MRRKQVRAAPQVPRAVLDNARGMYERENYWTALRMLEDYSDTAPCGELFGLMSDCYHALCKPEAESAYRRKARTAFEAEFNDTSQCPDVERAKCALGIAKYYEKRDHVKAAEWARRAYMLDTSNHDALRKCVDHAVLGHKDIHTAYYVPVECAYRNFDNPVYAFVFANVLFSRIVNGHVPHAERREKLLDVILAAGKALVGIAAYREVHLLPAEQVHLGAHEIKRKALQCLADCKCM